MFVSSPFTRSAGTTVLCCATPQWLTIVARVATINLQFLWQYVLHPREHDSPELQLDRARKTESSCTPAGLDAQLPVSDLPQASGIQLTRVCCAFQSTRLLCPYLNGGPTQAKHSFSVASTTPYYTELLLKCQFTYAHNHVARQLGTSLPPHSPHRARRTPPHRTARPAHMAARLLPTAGRCSL